MNNAANEPQKATSEESLPRPSAEELQLILEKHRQWVEAQDKAEQDVGASRGRADLSGVDLCRRDLRGAQLRKANLEEARLQNADLRGAHLEKANLKGARLQNADLRGAELQKADLAAAQLKKAPLTEAQLRKAILYNAQLEKAYLVGAQLQKADLRGAQLRKANLEGAQLRGAFLQGAKLRGAILTEAQLHEADLRGAQLQDAKLAEAQLQGARLVGAQLQGANLSFRPAAPADRRGAQLQGADLAGAQLQGANLARADLRGAYLTGANFDGEPGWDLPAADLTDADFRDADLANAQLSTVTGLRAEKLAGAVLTNAKLPKDLAPFDQLKHVEETSRNASTVFFGLLAASLYSWLTIATTTDAALITGTASSPLPIINTNIALSGFYLAAPLILIAVYCYFHLYLERLWGDLASLPARFPDGEALDRKAYPWLLNGLVRAHFHKLKLEERPLTRWENAVSILLAWWVVPLTLLAFWLRFLPRHDWWMGTALHVILIAGAAWFGVYSYRLAVRTLSGGATATEEEAASRRGCALFLLRKEEEGEQPLWARTWRAVRHYLPGGMKAAGAGVAIVLVLSADAWIDPGDALLTRLGSTLGYESYADLTDDDISTKPSGWTGWKETAGVEIAQVKGADLEGRDLRDADARRAFLAKAKLSEANLINANLMFADLRVADLRVATLSGANLSGANLSGANLSGANLSDADLGGADLSGANLSGANLSGANLSGANLSGADLREVDLSRADLSYAHAVTQVQLDRACGDITKLPSEKLTLSNCPGPAVPSSSPDGAKNRSGVNPTEPHPSRSGSSSSPRTRAGRLCGRCRSPLEITSASI